jgi:hypothetical protein
MPFSSIRRWYDRKYGKKIATCKICRKDMSESYTIWLKLHLENMHELGLKEMLKFAWWPWAYFSFRREK